jgi:hypothetical protein
MFEWEIAHLRADALATQIFAGTSRIMLEVLSHPLGL